MIDYLKNQGFAESTGSLSIHDDRSIEFMKFLGAPAFVMNTVSKGLYIPHSELDLSYEEPNNKSADKHSELLIKTYPL